MSYEIGASFLFILYNMVVRKDGISNLPDTILKMEIYTNNNYMGILTIILVKIGMNWHCYVASVSLLYIN